MRNLALVILVVAACGGGSGGGSVFGTGPITDEQADEICTADCQHDIDCGSGNDLASCVAGCKEDVVGWARADAVDAVFDCQLALECNASDDACLGLVDPLAIHEEWEAACRTDLAPCAETPGELDGFCEVSPSPADDEIGFVRFIAPPIVEEMIDCLPLPACDARLDCLQSVFASHNIDF